MLGSFQQLYQALVEHPWAATASMFAGAWVYERYRNARLSKALMDLSGSQIKGLANLELAFTSFKDTIVMAMLQK